MNFSEATGLFEISVRELCEDEETFHRVGFERSHAWRRLSLGGEAHRRIQSERRDAFPEYCSEVTLSGEIAAKGFRALVTGRLDGALPASGETWQLEEYKTCSFNSEGKALFPPEREMAARRQIASYCLLWERSGRGSARGCLVLIDPAGLHEETRPVEYVAEEAEQELRRLLSAKYYQMQAERRRLETLAANARDIAFPFESARPVQRELMDALHRSLAAGEHLLAQAPTGSGKTAAALHAGVTEALTQGKKLVFLTAKTLQQNLAVETLSKMNRGGEFRVLWMRAKAKMCANDRIICHEEHCRFAFGYPEKMARNGLLRRLLDTYPVLDPDSVFAEARAEEVCPFETQIELASKTDVFVGDYNYVFEPVTALQAFSRDELRRCILIVDEAHNLPDRVRKIYSPELDEGEIVRLSNQATLSPGELWRQLSLLLQELRELVAGFAHELPEEAGSAVEASFSQDAFEDFLGRWDPAMVSYFEWKRESGDISEEDPVLALHFQIVRFGSVLRLAEGHSDFARVAERTPQGIRVALVCLDPARILSPLFDAVSSAVLLSATLEPFEVTRRLNGLAEVRTAEIGLPPPFPRENRRIFLVPSVRTTFAAREKNYGKIAEVLAQMADAHPGNNLALFPSYRFLREVASRLPPVTARVIEQREKLSEFEKRQILAALESREESGLLFFAVAGGMYAEGVDYPGENLTGVFVVSPSLPQVSFERELLRRYFDDNDESGFEFAYIQPGMTRVIQAAGRLIRSETDRGVVALLCRRFLEEPYRRYLPRDWYDEDPSELVSRDPARTVRDFFAPR